MQIYSAFIQRLSDVLVISSSQSLCNMFKLSFIGAFICGSFYLDIASLHNENDSVEMVYVPPFKGFLKMFYYFSDI